MFHKYKNNAKNIAMNNKSPAGDMLRLSTQVSAAEYRCLHDHSSNDINKQHRMDDSECTEWVANIKYKETDLLYNMALYQHGTQRI